MPKISQALLSSLQNNSYVEPLLDVSRHIDKNAPDISLDAFLAICRENIYVQHLKGLPAPREEIYLVQLDSDAAGVGEIPLETSHQRMFDAIKQNHFQTPFISLTRWRSYLSREEQENLMRALIQNKHICHVEGLSITLPAELSDPLRETVQANRNAVIRAIRNNHFTEKTFDVYKYFGGEITPEQSTSLIAAIRHNTHICSIIEFPGDNIPEQIQIVLQNNRERSISAVTHVIRSLKENSQVLDLWHLYGQTIGLQNNDWEEIAAKLDNTNICVIAGFPGIIPKIIQTTLAKNRQIFFKAIAENRITKVHLDLRELWHVLSAEEQRDLTSALYQNTSVGHILGIHPLDDAVRNRLQQNRARLIAAITEPPCSPDEPNRFIPISPPALEKALTDVTEPTNTTPITKLDILEYLGTVDLEQSEKAGLFAALLTNTHILEVVGLMEKLPADVEERLAANRAVAAQKPMDRSDAEELQGLCDELTDAPLAEQMALFHQNLAFALCARDEGMTYLKILLDSSEEHNFCSWVAQEYAKQESELWITVTTLEEVLLAYKSLLHNKHTLSAENIALAHTDALLAIEWRLWELYKQTSAPQAFVITEGYTPKKITPDECRQNIWRYRQELSLRLNEIQKQFSGSSLHSLSKLRNNPPACLNDLQIQYNTEFAQLSKIIKSKEPFLVMRANLSANTEIGYLALLHELHDLEENRALFTKLPPCYQDILIATSVEALRPLVTPTFFRRQLERCLDLKSAQDKVLSICLRRYPPNVPITLTSDGRNLAMASYAAKQYTTVIALVRKGVSAYEPDPTMPNPTALIHIAEQEGQCLLVYVIQNMRLFHMFKENYLMSDLARGEDSNFEELIRLYNQIICACEFKKTFSEGPTPFSKDYERDVLDHLETQLTVDRTRGPLRLFFRNLSPSRLDELEDVLEDLRANAVYATKIAGHDEPLHAALSTSLQKIQKITLSSDYRENVRNLKDLYEAKHNDATYALRRYDTKIIKILNETLLDLQKAYQKLALTRAHFYEEARVAKEEAREAKEEARVANERTAAAEERTAAADGKTRTAEDETETVREKLSEARAETEIEKQKAAIAEEKERLAEEKTRIAERNAEEKEKLAQEKTRIAERNAEEKEKLAQEKIRMAERNAEEKEKLAEEKIRMAERNAEEKEKLAEEKIRMAERDLALERREKEMAERDLALERREKMEADKKIDQLSQEISSVKKEQEKWNRMYTTVPLQQELRNVIELQSTTRTPPAYVPPLETQQAVTLPVVMEAHPPEGALPTVPLEAPAKDGSLSSTARETDSPAAEEAPIPPSIVPTPGIVVGARINFFNTQQLGGARNLKGTGTETALTH